MNNINLIIKLLLMHRSILVYTLIHISTTIHRHNIQAFTLYPISTSSTPCTSSNLPCSVSCWSLCKDHLRSLQGFNWSLHYSKVSSYFAKKQEFFVSFRRAIRMLVYILDWIKHYESTQTCIYKMFHSSTRSKINE